LFIFTFRSLASSKAVYFPESGKKPIHEPSRKMVKPTLAII